ncbi:hypothetical protein EJ06DRAFT_511867 [Trichodelitschia bisporula]|uniref:MFS general substrate transporter n=1 Tax=Trichodelitschia bisporula TaxID=703511 RepID=A0A6G1HUD3_9PEZI|nr:hypothetical protein EJ06DRAFT_511867 [Trichodelitschia bisporula]
MAFSLLLPITASPLQAASYLLGVCLFSISFLVFLNSAVSFVITDRIGQTNGVGDAVGTLGFADELLALVACPIWGALSDRVGVRAVVVTGYAIVGVALCLFVQARNVYPQLLLGRLLFSLGGSATSTMVTAILPTMTQPRTPLPTPTSTPTPIPHAHRPTPSISSELTITPARFQARTPPPPISPTPPPSSSAGKLSGIVGMLTGIGALVALGFFLPLPTYFQNAGMSPGQAVADSFYVVGAIALVVAVGCAFGLRHLPGEEAKSYHALFKSHVQKDSSYADEPGTRVLSYPRLLFHAASLALHDVDIALAYVGGFVARASSVAISLFIPLYINAYFISSGRCRATTSLPHDPHAIKRTCQRAYILASILTGTSQLIALLCAPLFGYLSARYAHSNAPLLLTAIAGIAGYVMLGLLKNPDFAEKDGGPGVFIIVALVGVSQIGAIVCSLALVARGVHGEQPEKIHPPPPTPGAGSADSALGTPTPTAGPNVLPEEPPESRENRHALKGSIAGMYSLAGGAGILLLTKLGGVLFDGADVGGPFFMMAGFNAVLAAAVGVGWWVRGREKEGDAGEGT